jgi:hypothetical protein
MSYPQPKQGGGNRGLDDYVGVHTRVEKFRAEHPAGRILTSIVSSEPLTFRAEVYFDGSDVPNATGHANEEGGMGLRGKSAMEKTETAAVGRALAFCGYEIKEGLASREEMEKASQPPASVTPFKPKPEGETLDDKIKDCLKTLGYTENSLSRWCATQFPGFNGHWADLSEERKGIVYATFKAKADEKMALEKM